MTLNSIPKITKALATVSIIASIVQRVDFGIRVIYHLEEVPLQGGSGLQAFSSYQD